jgi:hypothetical protein
MSEHDVHEPFVVPRGQEHPSWSRPAYLCGECGEVSYADDWFAFKYDEEGENLIPAESGDSDPILRCPVCKTDLRDSDGSAAIWGGTRKEMYAERETQVANSIMADSWIGFWKDRGEARAVAAEQEARIHQEARGEVERELVVAEQRVAELEECRGALRVTLVATLEHASVASAHSRAFVKSRDALKAALVEIVGTKHTRLVCVRHGGTAGADEPDSCNCGTAIDAHEKMRARARAALAASVPREGS